jgi:hypothetical protein
VRWGDEDDDGSGDRNFSIYLSIKATVFCFMHENYIWIYGDQDNNNVKSWNHCLTAATAITALLIEQAHQQTRKLM